MKLKLDENGAVVLNDGKPVYVDDSGKEFSYDAPAMHQTISRLNREAQGNRERAEAFEQQLKAFAGLDPAAAKRALEVAKNLDESKLIEAGKVEEIKAAAIKSVEERYKPFAERAEALERELYQERIGGSFARSKVIAEKLIIPADLAQAAFGRHFELKDGKVQAKDAHGNLIYSDANPGNPADFDEALEKLIQSYPNRDKILRGTGHSGSGAGAVDGAGGSRVVTRAEFGKMNPAQQAKTALAAREGNLQIVD